MQENKTQNSNAQEQQNQDPSRQIFSSSFAKQNNHQVPEIKLPKGGGALKGIDEKFEVNPGSQFKRTGAPELGSSRLNDFQVF
jgi:hypothetical protein